MRIRKFFIILGLGSTLLVGSAFIVTDNPYFKIVRNLDIFASLFKEVNALYVDEIDPEKTIRVGIDAMLQSLDPYTVYIPEEDFDAYLTMTTGEYAGIGALIGRINDKVVITMPNEGFPAAKAGIAIGDQILSIDGIGMSGKSSREVSKLLKGPTGTEVKLKLLRPWIDSIYTVTIKRTKIILDNVPYYGFVTDEIGYIKLTDFTTQASNEVKNALVDLKHRGAKKIILDLRGNPGGILQEAVAICNLFIPQGKQVVETKGKQTQWNHTYNTQNSAVDTSIPLAVLTSSNSASASEIVSGTLQDYDRAVLVGRKTFGKGLVQKTIPLAYNSQLKVTTAKYYIPSGRCIQAIDYSHRNPDGSVGRIPDSLMVAFKTAHGRTVFDGGGINPDVEVESSYLSAISVSLINKALIFDYATFYFQEHKNKLWNDNSLLTEDEYANFITWLSDKDYDYVSPLEKAVTELKEEAKKEGFDQVISSEIQRLEQQVAHSKEKDMITFKDEINMLLSEEIASRYHLLKGQIASSLKHDPDVKAAIKVLEEPDRYSQLLALN